MTKRLRSLVALVLVGMFVADARSAEPRKPNIVFVLADDLGFSELGCYGNRFCETPNLDKLAKEGMRFTQAYAAAPVCSPYRAALLSGQHPARVGITDYLRPNSANALSTELVTLPEVLRKNGYSTGMVGKWHLTGYKHHGAEYESKPRDHGFGWDIAREVKGVGNGANFWPYVFRKQPISWVDLGLPRLGRNEYLVDRMNLEAVEFIERNKDRPFFLYLSHYATHTILNGHPRLVGKYIEKHRPGKSTRERCYLCQDRGHKGDPLHHWAVDHNPHLAAMLESIDDGIGKIRAKLEALGLAKNTIIVFTSDNGGETNVTSNAPLRGGKSQLYEGGIRVPLIVHWPGHVPAGRVSAQPTVNTDFYPTLLDAVGVARDPKHPLDGESMWTQWRGAKQANRTLYWHYPLDRPHFLGGVSAGAIRDGDWKLIEFFETGKAELYALAADSSERLNLAGKHLDRVRSMKAKLAKWRQTVEARTPSPPLLTTPRQLYFSDHFSSNRASERWAFNKDWTVEEGRLQRTAGGSTSRIFVRKPTFRDSVIRFDFRFGEAKEIRLVTGSGGFYNAVVHIHRDHFFLQTAIDRRGPFFPARHGECAFEFDPERWYTMTVEFLGDELVAHLDRDHLAYAKHPILDRERLYFAFQATGPAAFDNVQILTAAKHPEYAQRHERVRALSNKYPVKKSVAEEYKIRKVNAHDRLYRTDKKYRAIVEELATIDAENKKLYPDVFRSHKEFLEEINAERKRLLDVEPRYKKVLFAYYRSNRAIDKFLVARRPEIADWPDSRRLREIERIRAKHQKDDRYLGLVRASEEAKQRLEKAFPQLFVTNEQITESRNKKRKALEGETKFRERIEKRAATWRSQQTYLHEHDEKLGELRRRLDSR